MTVFVALWLQDTTGSSETVPTDGAPRKLY
jgi:hypothetical protein